MSSKTLEDAKETQEEGPLPGHLDTWYFVHSFLNVEMCHAWRSKSSRPYSGIKNVIQDSLEDTLQTQEESPLPVHIETWSFVNWNFVKSFLYVSLCQSWHSKSSKLHSGIKNAIQDSLEDDMETQEESLLQVHQECWNFAQRFLKSKVIQ